MIRTGSIKNMIRGDFKSELVIIVAGSGIPRSRYQHLLDSGAEIRHMARFAPSRATLSQYKEDGDEEAYIANFTNDMIKKNRIEELRSIVESSDKPVRLVCHEAEDGSFCHRHLLVSMISESLVEPVRESPRPDTTWESDNITNNNNNNKYEEESFEELDSGYLQEFDTNASEEGVVVNEIEEEVEEVVISRIQDEPKIRFRNGVPVRDSKILPNSWNTFYQQSFDPELPTKSYITARGHVVTINSHEHEVIVSQEEGLEHNVDFSQMQPGSAISQESKVEHGPIEFPIVRNKVLVEPRSNRKVPTKSVKTPSIKELTDKELYNAIRALKPNDKGGWIKIRGSKFVNKHRLALLREQVRRNAPKSVVSSTPSRQDILQSVSDMGLKSMYHYYNNYYGDPALGPAFDEDYDLWIDETIRVWINEGVTASYNFISGGYKTVKVQPTHDGYSINAPEEPTMEFNRPSGPRRKLSGINTYQVDSSRDPVHHKLHYPDGIVFDGMGMLDMEYNLPGHIGLSGGKLPEDIERRYNYNNFKPNGYKSIILSFEEVSGEYEWEKRQAEYQQHDRLRNKARRISLWVQGENGLEKATSEDHDFLDAKGRVRQSEIDFALDNLNTRLESKFVKDSPKLNCNKKAGGEFNLLLTNSIEIVPDRKAHIGQSRRWTNIFRPKEWFYYDPKHAEMIRPFTGEVMGSYIQTGEFMNQEYKLDSTELRAPHYAPFQGVYTQTKKTKKVISHKKFMLQESFKCKGAAQYVRRSRYKFKPFTPRDPNPTYLGVNILKPAHGIMVAPSVITPYPFVSNKIVYRFVLYADVREVPTYLGVSITNPGVVDDILYYNPNIDEDV